MHSNRSLVERLFSELGDLYRTRDDGAANSRGARYNLFQVIARHGNKDERYIHTPFLASLMDPHGEHDLGDTFLRAFLRRILDQPHGVPSESLETASIRVENDNVDIRIHLGGYEVILENKLRAFDREKQIWNYVQRATQPVEHLRVIYLTLHGKAPSNASLNQTPTEYTPGMVGEESPRVLEMKTNQERTVPVLLLSYETDVRNALQETLKKIHEDGGYRTGVLAAAEQYKELTDRIVRGKSMVEPSDEEQILSADSESLAVGLRVQVAASEAFARCVETFLARFEERFEAIRTTASTDDASVTGVGKRLAKTDFCSGSDRILDMGIPGSWPEVWDWVPRIGVPAGDARFHRALLWLGEETGEWAVSVELAAFWVFLGFVPLEQVDGGKVRARDVSGAGIPKWQPNMKGFGVRHAGKWADRSVVIPLAEVLSRGRVVKGSAALGNDCGMTNLCAADNVFDYFVQPVLGLDWTDLTRRLRSLSYEKMPDDSRKSC